MRFFNSQSINLEVMIIFPNLASSCHLICFGVSCYSHEFSLSVVNSKLIFIMLFKKQQLLKKTAKTHDSKTNLFILPFIFHLILFLPGYSMLLECTLLKMKSAFSSPILRYLSSGLSFCLVSHKMNRQQVCHIFHDETRMWFNWRGVCVPQCVHVCYFMSKSYIFRHRSKLIE